MSSKSSTTRKEIVQSVTTLAERVTAELGMEVVDVEYKTLRGQAHLIVYIDKPGGVTLSDCEEVNKLLSEALDIEDPISFSYLLEVSSPGVERPLKKPEDYKRFEGSAVQLKTYRKIGGTKNFKGLLKESYENTVLLQTEDGREIEIPFEEIAKANLWYKE